MLYSILLYSKGVIWQTCYVTHMCDMTPLLYNTERCDIAVPLNMRYANLYSMLWNSWLIAIWNAIVTGLTAYTSGPARVGGSCGNCHLAEHSARWQFPQLPPTRAGQEAKAVTAIWHALWHVLRLQGKLCKSGFISRPSRWWLEGGRHHHASDANSLLWQGSGAVGTAEWPPA